MQIAAGPAPCEEKTCYSIQVTCDQISQAIAARLRVGEPEGDERRGTLFLASGWVGNYFWGGEEELAPIEAAWADPNIITPQKAIQRFREEGYRTVEILWETTWFQAEEGHQEGMVNLACRPATVIRWVYDNLHGKDEGLPYCLSGHSNGASQVAYALADYDLDSIVNGVVFESGPNWSTIDNLCLHIDQTNAGVFGDYYTRSDLDWSYGFSHAGAGMCAQRNIQYFHRFRSDSLAYGESAEFDYPGVRIVFLIGSEDTSPTVYQALHYYRFLAGHDNPQIEQITVEGAEHWLLKTPKGAHSVVEAIEKVCTLDSVNQ